MTTISTDYRDYPNNKRVYQGTVGASIKLDTGVDLSSATTLEIRVMRPSGVLATWTASVYAPSGTATQSITYTTVSGDLDELGVYVLQSYVKGPGVEVLGDAFAIIVIPPYSIDDTDTVETMFTVLYRYITLQTDDEAADSSNEDADISSDAFRMYLGLAQDELASLVGSKKIPTDYITVGQSNMVLCHLIADYYEMGNPDWNFRSESPGSGVSITRGDDTGPRAAINKILDAVYDSWRYSVRSGIRMGEESLLKTKDHLHYPRRFKKTQIPTFDFSDDGFDKNESTESGFYNQTGSYIDPNY